MLVFDVETTGLPKSPGGFGYFYPPERLMKYASCRIVEIAWKRVDIDLEADYIVKPNGYPIYDNAVKVHGITTKFATDNGVDMHKALCAFLDAMKDVKIVIGHNVIFDRHVIASELIRAGLPHEAFFACKDVCTMCLAKDLFKGKYMKLTALYKKLFGHEFTSQHRALGDVKATVACYKAMIKLL